MSTHVRWAGGGRHELGQNFLVDGRVAAWIARLVPPGPVVELGPGAGALTRHLIARPDPITVVEIDPHHAAALERRFGRRVAVVRGDMLRFRERRPHHVVSNVPFGITAPLLRHVLGQSSWCTAVLLLQWEVARKRAAVGGTTQLTALWWPWIDFTLAGRVPADAFRPRPSVDGGVLVMVRRERPLLDARRRGAYQRFVVEAFRAGQVAGRRPRDLDARGWVMLFDRLARTSPVR
ncbi:23S rRNA (adenine-N6)-dimethyltransferase [Pseudonocardia thermophila]|jgi:Dimethyladenosine transferase (rRNA methylation)|uniref:23S rRNA (Adenine-N6)-dimethyltransferase n=1 Tax=Pseudonocardia thermophila TaxID=1848 RepID=A0A1M7AC91_PSETH|nr:rRNA adenine N(6)-methyltransferase family protein [Pseudonocardia thermophila]SHL40266.1 23S rRNA (adenine-N6)-dimethyltransferase [Pseudonocardia thermophila]